jgi:hypothetical protein
MTRSSIFSLLLAALVPCADAGTPATTLKIFITDHSGASPLLLINAGRQAAMLLARAGVRSTWKLCRPASELPGGEPCLETGSMAIYVRILPSDKASGWPIEPRSCGLALSGEAGEHGFLAIIDAGCVSRITGSTKTWVLALAHVIAHEIGHLLLGRGSHSASGLMSTSWTEGEQALLARGQLHFTAEDRVKIRDGMSARAAASSGVSIAAATGK